MPSPRLWTLALCLALAACNGQPTLPQTGSPAELAPPCRWRGSMAFVVKEVRVPLADAGGPTARVSFDVSLAAPAVVKTGLTELDSAWCPRAEAMVAAAEGAAAAALASATADDLATPAGAARAARDVQTRVGAALSGADRDTSVVVRGLTVE
jgi:hypothetical protein